MVDPDPTIQKEMEAESARLHKMYGGGDLTQFPDLKFSGKSRKCSEKGEKKENKTKQNLSMILPFIGVGKNVCDVSI